PGRTQTLNFYALTDSLCLVDLPGYGFAEVPHRVRAGWARMIEGYLTGRDQLKAILLLVDGRHGPTGDDLEMWEWIKASGRSGLAVATKWDKVKKSLRVKRMKEMEAALAAPVLPFSAVTSEGKQGLMSFLLSLVRSEEHTSELQSRENLVCRLLLEKKIITATASIPVVICETQA